MRQFGDALSHLWEVAVEQSHAKKTLNLCQNITGSYKYDELKINNRPEAQPIINPFILQLNLELYNMLFYLHLCNELKSRYDFISLTIYFVYALLVTKAMVSKYL